MFGIVLIVSIVVLAAAAFSAWWFSPHQRTLRAIRAVQQCRIADAPDGALVRVTGQLHAGPRLLEGPLSGRQCASYRVDVDVRVSSGENSRWRDLVTENETVDFVVDDGSGRAIVSASYVETAIVLDHHERSGTFDDATPEQEAFLRQHGHESTGFLGFNKTMRYREAALEPGETVVVVGRARWEDDPELGAVQPSSGGYRQSARRKRLVIEPPPASPLRVSDDPSALS